MIFLYYLKYFIITSIIGFILETILYKGDSGILTGPWTIVYGLGSIIILVFYQLIIQKLNLNQFLEIIIFFFSCIVLLSIIELIGGYLIEWIFGITFWDYSNYKFHIGKYICLEMAFIWGIASLIFIYILKPILDIVIKYIPNLLIYILLIIMFIDGIITYIKKH